MQEVIAVLGLGLACMAWWLVQRLAASPKRSCGGCTACEEGVEVEERLLHQEEGSWR